MAREQGPAGAGQGRNDIADEKQRRTLGDRANGSLRSANRSLRELSDPEERARFLLAEANVLALLELADAVRSSSLNGKP